MKLCISLAYLLISFTFSVHSQVYVSNSGIDAPGSGGLGTPYKTIQYAHDNSSENTIKVKADTYYLTSTINISRPVQLVKDGLGEVILDGSTWTSTLPRIAIRIHNTDSVFIDNIAIHNFISIGAKGIYVHGNCDNINILNCKIRNVGWKSNDLVTMPLNAGADNAHAIHIRGDMAIPITNVTLQKNHIANCATGFSEGITFTGYVDGLLVEKCKIDSIQNIGLVLAGNYADGNTDSTINRVRNGIIRDNEVSHCMSGKANSAGMYIDGAIHCLIETNKIHNNGVGISLGAEQPIPAGYFSGYNTISNNLVYNNAVSGIFLGSSNLSNTVRKTYIYNNLMYKNRTGEKINGVTTVNGAPPSSFADKWGGELHLFNSDSCQVYNNIIHALDSTNNIVVLQSFTTSNYKADHNLFYKDAGINFFLVNFSNVIFNGLDTGGQFNFSAYKSIWHLDSNSITLDPKYTDTATRNFKIQPSSSAKDKGTPTYNSMFMGLSDFDDSNRVVNGRIDIGPYECQFVTPTSNGVQSSSERLILYPNPSNDKLYFKSKHQILFAKLINMNGEQIKTYIMPQESIDVFMIPEGFYNVLIQLEGGQIYSEKILVCH